MKALTIKQPWAWAIVHAGKDIENRSWLTRYRGELAIHAGARMHDCTKMPRGVRAPEDDDLAFSAIIGIVEVVDSVEKSRSKWFMGPCGLVLRNARPLEKPVPCTGKLGLSTRRARSATRSWPERPSVSSCTRGSSRIPSIDERRPLFPPRRRYVPTYRRR